MFVAYVDLMVAHSSFLDSVPHPRLISTAVSTSTFPPGPREPLHRSQRRHLAGLMVHATQLRLCAIVTLGGKVLGVIPFPRLCMAVGRHGPSGQAARRLVEAAHSFVSALAPIQSPPLVVVCVPAHRCRQHHVTPARVW